MKIPLLILGSILGLFVRVHAQQNSCNNRIRVYAPETTVQTLDSAAHAGIKKYMKSYIVSQQQSYNYRLVDSKEEADLELITDYTLENPELWSQTTKISFIIRDVEFPSISRTIIEAYNTPDKEYWGTGKDVVSHDGVSFIQLLQNQNSLYPFFAPVLQHKYQHVATPDKILVIKPFETELPYISGDFGCLQSFLLQGLQSRLRFEKHNMNAALEAAPSSTPESALVVNINTEVIEQYDEYIFIFTAENFGYLDEISVKKSMIDNKRFRPFVEGKVAAAGGGLIKDVLRKVR